MPGDAGSGKAVGPVATMNATAAAVNQKRRVGMTRLQADGDMGTVAVSHRPLVMRNGTGLAAVGSGTGMSKPDHEIV
jgi:hypothetical protein